MTSQMLHPLILICFAIMLLLLCAQANAGESAIAAVPERQGGRPLIAATAEQIQNLRDRYRGSLHWRRVIDHEVIVPARRALATPLNIPPRGGQHNMWYQCEKCQTGLQTISDTEHRCPRCRTVYSGEPFDDALFKRRHEQILEGMWIAAWAYAITDDPQFARYTAAVLLEYADRYLKYPRIHASRETSEQSLRAGGRMSSQTLDEATYLLRRFVPAYDLIHDSPELTTENHERIREKLLRPMLESVAANQRGKSNWQSYHNAAMLWTGAVLGEPQWIERAIHDPENGFLFQMENSVTSDGMWFEGSWSYHSYTLTALAATAQGAANIGIDLWSRPELQRMYTLPVQYVMADGSLPRFGNATTTMLSRLGRGAANVWGMEAGFAAYGDDRLLPMLNPTPTWVALLFGTHDAPGRGRPPQEHRSVLIDGAGHAILRTAGPAGLTAALTFGPHGGFHSHFDKLSFVLFGYGQELAVDRGRAASQAYRLPIHQQWYRATISHNTVVVDGQSQEPATGELHTFAANDRFAAVLASTDAAYDGVRHKRLLLLTPSYAVVFDQLESDRRRNFDWMYHNRGNSVHSGAIREIADLRGQGGGMNHIQRPRWGVSDEMFRIAFLDEKVVTYLHMAGAADTAVMVGDGPGSSVSERIPLALVFREGRSANFAAVIEPRPLEQPPDVQRIDWRREDERIVIDIERSRGAERIVLHADDRITVESAGELVFDSNARPD